MVSEYRNKNQERLIFVGALIFSFFVLLPIYVLVIIAFADPSQTIGSTFPKLVPTQFTLSNLQHAFSGYGTQLIQAFEKSLITAFIVGGLAVLLGFHAAFGLSKIPQRIGNTIIGVLFFSTMMPSLTIAIPISVTFLSIGLNETALGLALAQELVVLPLTVFLIQGTIGSIPRQLENQARVDGANFPQMLYGVLFPLALPGVLSAFLISWLMSWDEFTFAAILASSHPTLPILIFLETSGRTGNLVTGSAFALLVTIPVIVLTLVLSKFIKGNYLTAGITG